MEKEARILKKNKEVYGRVWRKEKEMRNDMIILCSKKKKKQTKFLSSKFAFVFRKLKLIHIIIIQNFSL